MAPLVSLSRGQVTLVTVPVLAVFLSFRRAFVSSIASSGVKA